MAKRQLTGAALTAKMIKKKLTSLYPRVKFSVTSDTFSMGDSVSIKWTDGPLYETVNDITKQYQHGSFNSMEDIYEYESIDPSLGCKGAKYVQCSREISSELWAILAAKADEHFGVLDPNGYGYYGKLKDIEKMFFPYPEAEQKSRATIGQGSSAISGLEYEIIEDKDTRDNSDIFVVKIKTRVDDFKSLRQKMDSLGGYYSRFKRGFIFKDDPTAILAGHPENVVDVVKEDDCA